MRTVVRIVPALLLLVACRSGPRTSLLLVTLDTVRADRLGCYGSSLGLTPRIDELCSESIRFAEVTSQTPLTTPSHATILTGLLPQHHGIRNNESFRLAESTATIATVLRSSGYRTAAFIGAFPLHSRYGLARGFDVYDQEFLRDSTSQERSATEVLSAAERFIEEQSTHADDEPFFVWAHLYDAHSPYEPPPAFRERFPGDPYGGEIASLDDALGRFLEKLRSRGDLDRLVVSVVADHGEALGEHGESTHGVLLYEPTLRVPWLVRLPRGRLGGTSVNAPVRTLDVAPTLLGLLKAPGLDGADGVDLSPFLEKRSIPDLASYAESYYLHLLLGWAELTSLRRGSLKAILGTKAEVFDLNDDPGETINLLDEARPDAKALLKELRDASAGNTTAGGSPAAPAREETTRALSTLGYVTGATTGKRSSRDPRDGMAIWLEIESGTSLLGRDRSAARAHFDKALALDPRNGLALKSLGDLALAEGRDQEALERYREASGNGFSHPDLDLGLARALLATGRAEEARAPLARFLSERPDNGDGLLLQGRLERAQGHEAEAESALRRALEALPRDGSVLNELGSALADLGRREEAKKTFAQAIEVSPRAAEPRRNLALLLDGVEAERLRREAIELDPNYPEPRIELAQQLAENGRVSEAERQIHKAIELRPDDPQALFIAARAAELAGRAEIARGFYRRFLTVAPPNLAEAREMAQRRLEALGRKQ